jgi:hypothetical protein
MCWSRKLDRAAKQHVGSSCPLTSPPPTDRGQNTSPCHNLPPPATSPPSRRPQRWTRDKSVRRRRSCASLLDAGTREGSASSWRWRRFWSLIFHGDAAPCSPCAASALLPLCDRWAVTLWPAMAGQDQIWPSWGLVNLVPFLRWYVALCGESWLPGRAGRGQHRRRCLGEVGIRECISVACRGRCWWWRLHQHLALVLSCSWQGVVLCCGHRSFFYRIWFRGHDLISVDWGGIHMPVLDLGAFLMYCWGVGFVSFAAVSWRWPVFDSGWDISKSAQCLGHCWRRRSLRWCFPSCSIVNIVYT